MSHTKTRGGNLRAIMGLLIGAIALIGAACVPPDEGGGSGSTTTSTTTTTSVAPDVIETLDAVDLEWTLSREMNNGAYNGQANWWSAGATDGTSATYNATDGDVTVLKQNAAGTFVEIGSEPAVDWSNRLKNGQGATVTPFNPELFLGQKLVLSNGEGTHNLTTGAITVAWEGTFSVNFYGTVLPFWLSDFELTVDANGVGQLTATIQGYGSSIDNPDERELLEPQAGVVVADLPNVDVSNGSFTANAAYIGTEYLGGDQTPLNESSPAFWGSWPQSFVEYQELIGAAPYYYSSGGTADALKPQDPISVDLGA